MQASTGSEDEKVVEPRIMRGVHGIDELNLEVDFGSEGMAYLAVDAWSLT